jgi:hypothetical protein
MIYRVKPKETPQAQRRESDARTNARPAKRRLTPMGDEYGGFLLLNIFDLFLTSYIFRHGGEEVNPIGVHVMERYGMGGYALFKFGMVAFVIILAEIVYRLRPARARALMTGANFMYFGVILWECLLLWYRYG